MRFQQLVEKITRIPLIVIYSFPWHKLCRKLGSGISRGIFLLVFLILLFPVKTSADPYAWPQFTVGNGEFRTSSNMEQWLASFVHSSKENNSEVGMISFTYGTGNNDIINGFFGNSNAGLNSIDPSLAFPTGDGSALSDFNEVADNDLENRTSFAPTDPNRITHYKGITAGTSRCIVGTANLTAGGFSSQPNVMVHFDNQTDVCNASMSEIKEIWNGNNWDNDVQWTVNQQGPNGEEIEVYFYPDVYQNIPEGDLLGVINREVDEASESVFYLLNRLTRDSLADNFVSRSDDILVEGIMDTIDDNLKEQLEQDHTARDWNLFEENTEMHHKTMIFDMEKIAFGSANHTASAMEASPTGANQESLFVIDDFRLGRKFVQEYKKLMEKLPEETIGQPDSFDQQAPESVTNVQAENVSGEGHSLRVTWEPPSDPGDFSRYYIFASTDESEVNSANAIGDGVDDDGDGLIDEDPAGDVDGFASGFDLNTQKACDDDGDGECDEDPFMFPEAQVKAINPSADTDVILDSINYGEELPNNTDIFLAVVAVDKHGNESDPALAGPAQSQPAIPGAEPDFSLDFQSGASNKAGVESTLKVDVNNDSGAAKAIGEVHLDMQEASNSFDLSSSQTAPDGWSIQSLDGSSVQFEADSNEARIHAGDTVTFFVDVTNPDNAGPSEDVLGTTIDEDNTAIRGIIVGSLDIEEKEAVPGGSVSYASADEDTRAGRTSEVTASITNEGAGSADIREITLTSGSNANSSFRFLEAVSSPSGWTVDSVQTFEISASTGDTTAEIEPGESIDFTFEMRNPRGDGLSDTFQLSVVDDQDNNIEDTPLNGIQVRASEAIVFNEFMYSPEGEDDDFEWIEIFNLNANSDIEIGGWEITVDGESFTVSEGTIVPADGFQVFANDVSDRDDDGQSFSSRYSVSAIEGPAWLLDNDSDQMAMNSGDGSYSVTLQYDDTLAVWGTGADNTGRSFVKIDPTVRDVGEPSTDGENWEPSGEIDGSPGAENSTQKIIESQSATDGTNTLNTFDGSDVLREADVTVTLDLVNAPSDPPTLYFDADASPDGPGGSTSDESVEATAVSDGDSTTFEAVIPASSGKVDHDVEIRYLWDIDGQIVNNSGNFYRYSVDGLVSSPENLAVSEVVGNQVTLTFDPITDDDFQRYDVFYARTSPVSSSDTVQSFTTQDPGADGITVTDLADETQYQFNISAVDNVGNTSPLDSAEEVSATTQKGFTVNVTRAEDGVNSITNFDGSSELRDADMTITWETEEVVEDAEVSLFYDILDSPDGEGGSNTGDRKRASTGSDTFFQSVIPSSDEEFEPGRTVEFVVQIGDQTFFNENGEPFAIQIGSGVDRQVDDFQVEDQRAGEIDLTWDAIPQISDFSTYRIYYDDTHPINAGDQHWDKSDDIALKALTTTNTTIDGLDPNKTYFFRITVVNDLGSEGPFSSRIQGQTNTKSSVLISEVNFDSTNGFDTYVELTALAGPIDISGFKLTDIQGTDEDTFANDPVTLSTGERAIVHPHDGTPETDQSGDLNGNGHVDLFTTNLANFTGGPDDIVLRDGAGNTIDAIIYRRDANDDFTSFVDTPVLVPDHWDGGQEEDAIITYAQSGLSMDDTPAIGRKTGSSGKLRDTNSKEDWETTTVPTPGESNEFLRIEDITISDSPDRETHFSQASVDIFDGRETLKPTTSRRFEIQFSQPPIQHERIQVVWDHNANPTLTSDSASLTPDPEFDPSTLRATGSVDISGDAHGDEERVMLLSQRVLTTPSQLDFIEFKRNGRFYRYQLDGVATEDDLLNFTDFEIQDGKVSLAWVPVSESDHPDFQEYLIFMDTGPVTLDSRVVGQEQISSLGSIDASNVDIDVSQYDRTWNFRLAVADQHGNISDITKFHTTPVDIGDFSDTVSTFVPEPISLTDFKVSDGTNKINYFENSDGDLRSDSVNVTVSFDRKSDTVIVHWNTDPGTPANPDSSTDGDTETTLTHDVSTRYTGELPPLAHGTEVSLALETGGDNFDRSGQGYDYEVDDVASPAVSGFGFGAYSPAGSNLTDITVGWEPLAQTDEQDARDFQRYEVLYDTDLNLTNGGEQVFSTDKDSSLGDSRVATATVKGLASSDSYAFGVRWVDEQGNVSTISDTFDTETINGEPSDDPVFDGNTWATILDGSEYLRGGQNYLVRFRFFSRPENPDNVKLVYNALDANREPFEGSGTTGEIKLRESPVDSLTWEGTIESADPGVSDAEKIAYYVEANGLKFSNSRQYFRFRLDHSPVDEIGNTAIDDRGDEIRLYWSTTNLSDFKTYRIRYRKSTANEWTTVDKSNDSTLGNQSNGSRSFSVDPDANYEMNVTVVDRAEWTQWLEQNLLIKRTENFTPVLEVEPRYIKLYPDETGNISVYLEDLDGNPWSNQQVVWRKTGGPGDFVNSSDTSVETSTNSSGQTAVEFSAGSEENWFTHFELTFPESPGVDPVDVGVYTVPSGKDKASYKLFTD